MSFSVEKTSGLSDTALASVAIISALIADLGETGTHDLGLAAQGIGVLDRLAVFMGDFDFAVIEEPPVAGRNIDLALMATDLMNQRIEGAATAQRSLNAETAGNHGGGKQLFGGKESFQGKSGRGLGAV